MSRSSKPFGSFPMRKSKSLSDLLGGQGGLHLSPNAIVAGTPEDVKLTTSPITSLETSMAQSLKISEDSHDHQDASLSPPPSASSSSTSLDSDDSPTNDAASPPPSAAPPHPPPTSSPISSPIPTAVTLPQVTPPRQYVPNTPGLKEMPVPKGPAPKFTPPVKSSQAPSKDAESPPIPSPVSSSSSKQPALPSKSSSGLKSANGSENTKSMPTQTTPPPRSSSKQPDQQSESSSAPKSAATEPETKDARPMSSPPPNSPPKQTAQPPESSTASKPVASMPETKGKTAEKNEKQTKVETEKKGKKSGQKVKSKKGKKGPETINSSDAPKAPSSPSKPVGDQVPKSAAPPAAPRSDALPAKQCEEILEEDHNFTDLPPLPSSPSVASEDENPLDPSKDPGPTATDSTPKPSAKDPPHHTPSKKQESSKGPSSSSNNDAKASSPSGSNSLPVSKQSQARPPQPATPLAKKAAVSPPTPQTPSHHLFGPFAYHRPPPAPPTPPGSILRPALNTNWSAWRDSSAIPPLTGVASTSTSSSRPHVSSTQTPKPPVAPPASSSHPTVNPMWGPHVAPSAASSIDKGKGKAKEPDGPSTTASASASVSTPAFSQSNPAPQVPPQNTAPSGSSAPASTSLAQPSTQVPSSNPPPAGVSVPASQDDAMSWTPSDNNNAPSGSSQPPPPPPMQTQPSLNPAFLDIEMGGSDAGQPRLTSQQPQPGLFSGGFQSQIHVQNPPTSTSLPSQQQTVAQPPVGFFSSFTQAPAPTQQAASNQMPAGGFFSSFIQHQQQQPAIQQQPQLHPLQQHQPPIQQPSTAQNPQPQPSSAPMSSFFSGFAQSLADGFASLKGQASASQGHGNASSHIPGPSSSTNPTQPVYFQREGCRPHPILFALCQISPEACAKMRFPGQELLQPGLPPTVYPRDFEEFYQRTLSWLHTLNLPPCPYTVSFPSSESESVSGDAPEWFLHLCQEFAPFDRDVGNIWVFACWAGIESKQYSVEHLRRVRSASVVNPSRFEGHMQEGIVKRAKTWKEGCSTLYLAKHCSISKLKDVPRRFRVRRKPYSV